MIPQVMEGVVVVVVVVVVIVLGAKGRGGIIRM